MINSTTHNREEKKVEELKERNYRTIFMKREHRCWNRRREDICVDLSRVRNEDTPGNQIKYIDENRKIYNSIFAFKEDAPTEKRIAELFKRRTICKKKVQQIKATNGRMIEITQAGVTQRPLI